MLLATYYALNYAGIIGRCLAIINAIHVILQKEYLHVALIAIYEEIVAL